MCFDITQPDYTINIRCINSVLIILVININGIQYELKSSLKNELVSLYGEAKKLKLCAQFNVTSQTLCGNKKSLYFKYICNVFTIETANIDNEAFIMFLHDNNVVYYIKLIKSDISPISENNINYDNIINIFKGDKNKYEDKYIEDSIQLLYTPVFCDEKKITFYPEWVNFNNEVIEKMIFQVLLKLCIKNNVITEDESIIINSLNELIFVLRSDIYPLYLSPYAFVYALSYCSCRIKEINIKPGHSSNIWINNSMFLTEKYPDVFSVIIDTEKKITNVRIVCNYRTSDITDLLNRSGDCLMFKSSETEWITIIYKTI